MENKKIKHLKSVSRGDNCSVFYQADSGYLIWLKYKFCHMNEALTEASLFELEQWTFEEELHSVRHKTPFVDVFHRRTSLRREQRDWKSLKIFFLMIILMQKCVITAKRLSVILGLNKKSTNDHLRIFFYICLSDI